MDFVDFGFEKASPLVGTGLTTPDIERVREEGPYDVILMDPPWHYYGSGTKMAAAAKHYPLMTDEDLGALPVGSLLNKRGMIFMWVTSSTLKRSIALFDQWSEDGAQIHYRGIAFVWVKTSKNGQPFGARGVRPSITKPLTEMVIVGSRVEKGRPMPLHDEGIRQTIFAPVGRHSAKPPHVHDALEKMYPGARNLEMFCRTPRPGWVCWGNEMPGDVT